MGCSIHAAGDDAPPPSEKGDPRDLGADSTWLLLAGLLGARIMPPGLLGARRGSPAPPGEPGALYVSN